MTLSKIINLKKLKDYLLKNYGKKCRDTHWDCIRCRVWIMYQDIKNLIGVEEWTDKPNDR